MRHKTREIRFDAYARFNILDLCGMCEVRASQYLHALGDPPDNGFLDRSEVPDEMPKDQIHDAVIIGSCHEVIRRARNVRRFVRSGETRKASREAFALSSADTYLLLDYYGTFDRSLDGEKVELQRLIGREAALSRRKPSETVQAAIHYIRELTKDGQHNFKSAAEKARKRFGVSRSTIERFLRKSRQTGV